MCVCDRKIKGLREREARGWIEGKGDKKNCSPKDELKN